MRFAGVFQMRIGGGFEMRTSGDVHANTHVIVDRHKQRLPARSVHAVAPVACDPMAGAHDAPKGFGIDVQHLPGRFMLVAHQGLSRL